MYELKVFLIDNFYFWNFNLILNLTYIETKGKFEKAYNKTKS